tara:strand:- start:865 stop:1080 length:216 start_codon:yes stop_codon:yes gene_type:complete
MNIEDFYKALYKMRDLPDHPAMRTGAATITHGVQSIGDVYINNSPLTFASDRAYEQYVGLEMELLLVWRSY